MVVTTAEQTAINGLRKLVPVRETPVTIEQMHKLVSMLDQAWYGPGQICDATGLPADVVFDLIIDLGTFLGQSVNGGQGAKVLEAAEAPATVVEAVRPRKGGPSTNQLGLFSVHTDEFVVMPHGFERASAGRDLTKAIPQIVRSQPNEATLRRWLMRRYHRIHKVLTFDIVAVVHRVAQLERLDELDQVCVRNGRTLTELARVFVEAFDFLDVARADAAKAVRTLCDLADVADLTVEPMRSTIDRSMRQAEWLHEGVFTRLRRSFDISCDLGEDRQLAKSLKILQRTVDEQRASWEPRHVADLSDGQVLRLSSREGLNVDMVRFDESEVVRNLVWAAGLGSDADLLIADGVRAVRAGLHDEFAAALSRRAEGELEWADDLNRRLAAVARA